VDSRAGTTPIIVIVGETASGKSALALHLAERHDGEIICADALTVRRGVDIGTAKPTDADRARVPHHLIDVAAPCQDFTAAVFKERALSAIEDIAARGSVPFLVGGTGLYIDAVLYDYSFLPAGNRQGREALNDLSVEQLLELASQRGLNVSDIDIRNKRRIIRLLETGGQHATKTGLRPNTLILGISQPREQLRERVTSRVDRMLQDGLEQEVRGLAKTYGWQCEALKGIGYREWQAYFNDQQTMQETKEKIIKSTLDLAKKQRTWFRRNNSIHWVDDPSKIEAIVTTFLSK